MIRQAISCDICGAEKRQTNHWFVAYEQAGELRVSGWTSRQRMRPGSKHLCGQTCLHKLMDDFMARAIAVRPQVVEAEFSGAVTAATDTSLISPAAYAEMESPLRLPAPAAPLLAQSAQRAHPELLTMPGRMETAEFTAPLGEPPRSASRNWRAEAWERERERELRAAERRPDIMARRGP
ncbi:MAG: hypothetical protein WBE72_15560 [Terracidiphilus sp.]